MNKAFVREPEAEERVYCPQCGTLGVPVEHSVLDRRIVPAARQKVGDAAWFCGLSQCDATYFNTFGAVVLVAELSEAVYPKDLDAPLCGCFPFFYDDVAADVEEGAPTRTRQLLAKSKSSEARCHELAADGRCCLGTVQALYMKLVNE